jgi:uncharacterized protein with HEPN domain
VYNICDKIDFVLEKISLSEEIPKENKITFALKDEKVLKPAILMHLMQIGESLNSIYKKFPELIEKYDLEDAVKGSYNVRNFIAHDYEGVNLAIIEMILRNEISKLKTKLKRVKNECE